MCGLDNRFTRARFLVALHRLSGDSRQDERANEQTNACHDTIAALLKEIQGRQQANGSGNTNRASNLSLMMLDPKYNEYDECDDYKYDNVAGNTSLLYQSIAQAGWNNKSSNKREIFPHNAAPNAILRLVSRTQRWLITINQLEVNTASNSYIPQPSTISSPGAVFMTAKSLAVETGQRRAIAIIHACCLDQNIAQTRLELSTTALAKEPGRQWGQRPGR